MPSVDCAGGQDRDSTTSETKPHIPPPKTKNCYLNDKFDRDNCGTVNDQACIWSNWGTLDDSLQDDVASIGPDNCTADSAGGYCGVNKNLYTSIGPTFVKLNSEALLKRYGGTSSSSDNSANMRRALNDQERKFTNRIRELQIMGKNPLQAEEKGGAGGVDNEVHSVVGDMLLNIGMGATFIMFLISISIYLIQKKKI